MDKGMDKGMGAKKADWTPEERALVQCFTDVARNYFIPLTWGSHLERTDVYTPPEAEAKERITIHMDFALIRTQNANKSALADYLYFHIAYAEAYLTAFGL